MNKRILLLAAIPGFTLYSCNSNKLDYSKYRDTSIAPISGMIAPPHLFDKELAYKDQINQEQYTKLKSLGFNTVIAMYELDRGKDDTANLQYILDSLNYAKNVGINYIAKSGTIYDGKDREFKPGDFTTNKTMSRYKDYDNFIGHIITDEPAYDKFDLLAKTHEFYKTEFPNKTFYVNLNPTYAPPEFYGPTKKFEDYIQGYIDIVKPDFVSFDHYSLRVGDKGEGIYSIRDDSLFCRETVAYAASNAGIPYINYTMTTSSRGEKREMSHEYDISFQVMTDLAYGCSGIQYFCIYEPQDNPGAQFKNSIIDNNGDITKIGMNAKILNNMMLNMDEAYLNYAWKGTMTIEGSEHEGEDKNPAYLKCKHSITSFDGIKSYEASNYTLIGCFKSKVDDHNGFMITNFEEPSNGITDHVKINFDNANALLTYSKEGTKYIDLNNSTYELDIAPGDGIFVIPYTK